MLGFTGATVGNDFSILILAYYMVLEGSRILVCFISSTPTVYLYSLYVVYAFKQSACSLGREEKQQLGFRSMKLYTTCTAEGAFESQTQKDDLTGENDSLNHWIFGYHTQLSDILE